MAMAQKFNATYLFKKNNKVVIQHRKNGNFNGNGHVRVQQNGAGVEPDGGKGDFAHWMAELQGGDKVMFKSPKTGKYLRIGPNGGVDAAGGAGPFCTFKVHHLGDGLVKLEATKTGKYLAYNPNKGIHSGGGGDFCKFKVKRDGQGGGGGQQHHGGGGGQHHGGGGGGQFSNAYEFKVNNTVVIQHRQNNNFQGFHSLRVTQDGKLTHNGGKGDWAQWIVERENPNKVKIKSVKTGKYLRIEEHQNANGFKVNAGGGGGSKCLFKVHHKGGAVMLESVKFDGRYIAVDNNGIRTGDGGDHCKLKFFRK